MAKLYRTGRRNYLLHIIRYGVVCGEFMFFMLVHLSTEACMHGRMHTNVIHCFSDQTLSTSTHTHTTVTRARTILRPLHPAYPSNLQTTYDTTTHLHSPSQNLTRYIARYIHQNGNLTKSCQNHFFVIVVVVAMTPQLPEAVTPVSLVSPSRYSSYACSPYLR